MLKYLLYSIFFVLFACSSNPDEENTLFELIDSNHSTIHFANELKPTEELNMYVFKNYYNGGGVAIGDINNDGLQDIYFTGNEVDNKLYINQGDFTFKDITESAGVACPNVWSTGASFVDINQDGYLDLYVCKSGPPEVKGVRHNELFINQGDQTFKEQAVQYGLDFTGLGVHAVFFDYDKDDDLDCYLLNNSIRSVGGYDLIKDQRLKASANGNKLLQNQEGIYVDVSEQAGIYTSEIGFGLGVTIGDINQDGWQDMYVSNDYFEKDYLYINQQDGTFSEQLEDYFSEISLSSMGADFADLNNDHFPDLFVTDMLPEPIERYRTKTNFMGWKRYSLQQKQGYFNQFVRNSLQLNRDGLFFQEISRFADVAATDWSWGALIFDMDNDGKKDIYVANGIGKDLTDQDYVNFYANKELVQRQMKKNKSSLIMTLMENMPSEKLIDYAFINQGGHTPMFTNKAKQLGISKPSFSNGSAYADLDNDGDLDLVVNHVDDEAGIYKNGSSEHFIKFQLETKTHQLAHGAKVFIYADSLLQYQEIAPYRGFQSCVDPRPNFGLGSVSSIDSIHIQWANNQWTKLVDVPVDSIYVLIQPEENTTLHIQPKQKSLFTEELNGNLPKHFENITDAFSSDPLLLRTRSKEGPRVCSIDANGDGLVDYYLPGAKDIPGTFLLQSSDGNFEKQYDAEIRLASSGEEVNVHAFDANGDGLVDLYVCFGGDEFDAPSTFYEDILYLHQADGSWKRSTSEFPNFSTSVAISEDIDQDGDLDLYIAPRCLPGRFGVPVQAEIWLNDGQALFQKNEDWTNSVAYQGFVTDAIFHDLDSDGVHELIVIGEWGSPTIYKNNGKNFEAKVLPNVSGLWNRLYATDVDNDGDSDLLVGNIGLNSFLKADQYHPLKLFVHDFDENGEVEQFVTFHKNGNDYTYTLRDELVTAVPELKHKYLKFDDYKSATIKDMFGKKVKENYQATQLQSGWFEQTDGQYIFHPFPIEAQLYPIFAISEFDYPDSQNKAIILGGNYGECKPQLGSYLSGRGTILHYQNGALHSVSPAQSGLILPFEVRDFAWQNENRLLVFNNNSRIQLFTLQ